VIGTVVQKDSSDSYQSITIDDGTGVINIRGFEDRSKLFEGISVGDAVMIMGRPRQFGSQVYMAPEIVRRIMDRRWIDVRMLELPATALPSAEEVASAKAPALSGDDSVEEIDISSRSDTKGIGLPQKVLAQIRELDKGEGASYDDVAQRLGDQAEAVIKMMMEQGELFEIKPGKLKVLE
jgi:RPA family protein